MCDIQQSKPHAILHMPCASTAFASQRCMTFKLLSSHRGLANKVHSQAAAAAGRTWDLLVLDPPKLAPNRKSLQRATRRYQCDPCCSYPGLSLC